MSELFERISMVERTGWHKWLLVKQGTKEIFRQASLKRAAQIRNQRCRYTTTFDVQKLIEGRDANARTAAKRYREKCRERAKKLKDYINHNLEEKAAWHLLNGDRCTRQFFQPFKFKKKELISRLRREVNTEPTDSLEEMADIARDFYESLYAKEDTNYHV